jgi:hypothetical protein
MRISSAGNVGIGVSNPTALLHTNGNVVMQGGTVKAGASSFGTQAGDLGVSRDAAPTTGAIYFGSSGANYINYNGTAWVFSPALPSDARLKRNVTPLAGGLAVINQLRPVAAEWNGLGGHKSGERVVSLVAQELEKILPGTIVPYKAKLRKSVDGEWGNEETELLSYDPTEIIMHLILAVQQLAKK